MTNAKDQNPVDKLDWHSTADPKHGAPMLTTDLTYLFDQTLIQTLSNGNNVTISIRQYKSNTFVSATWREFEEDYGHFLVHEEDMPPLGGRIEYVWVLWRVKNEDFDSTKAVKMVTTKAIQAQIMAEQFDRVRQLQDGADRYLYFQLQRHQ